MGFPLPVSDEIALDQVGIVTCGCGLMSHSVLTYALMQDNPGIRDAFFRYGGTREELTELEQRIQECPACSDMYRTQILGQMKTATDAIHQ